MVSTQILRMERGCGPRWSTHLLTVALLAFAVFPVHAAADRLDLAGRVVDESNQPLPGAIVAIYSAGPRVGTSVYCPTCYVDCSKRVKSDEQGEFKITGLDPTLIFRVYAAADRFTPKFFEKTDPRNGRVEFRLEPMDPEWMKPGHVLRGRVVDARGGPVVGAVIEPFGMDTGGRRWWGRLDDVSQLAISDENGEFEMVSKFKDYALDLRMEARGFAPKLVSLLRTSPETHQLVLDEGAYVKGVLLKDGRPVPNVELGLVQENRTPDHFLGEKIVATDELGRFLFSNVATGYTYFLYSRMQGMQSIAGAPHLPQKAIRVPADGGGNTIELDQLALQPSRRVHGRVVLSDGGRIPEGVRMYVGRDEAWDSLSVELPPDGRFEINGFPDGESSSIALRIRGYQLSSKNPGLRPVNGPAIIGRVVADLDDFVILMEPGDDAPRNAFANDQWQRYEELMKTPLRGVTD